MAYRIIHCLRAPVGGLFRHVRDLTEEQNNHGHSVGVIYDAIANDALSAPRLKALSAHLSLGLTPLPMSRGLSARDSKVVSAITALARNNSADIIHGHGAKGGAYARLAARSLRRRGAGIKCIYTPHGGSLHFPPSTLKGRVYMGMERYLARHTSAIAFESAYSQSVYANQIGQPSCLNVVIANGVLEEEFAPVAPAPQACDFLFMGELRHLKGVDIMLRALKMLSQSRTVSAAIVGAGPDEAEFKALCSSLNLDDKVTFCGALPARSAFSLGRVLIMPSRAESFPYIILEAAAAGLPLIASSVGGIPEIVASTDTALLPPGDVDAFARAMSDFLDNEDAALARAQRLQAQIAEKFTVSAMAEGIDNLYAAAPAM